MPLQQSQQEQNVIQSKTIAAAGTTQSSGVYVGGALDWVAIQVNVSAIGGTNPSLTLSVQWSQDNGTTWSNADTADAFTAITANGNVAKRFPVKGHQWRFTELFAGTATPTVTYTAHQLFR